MKLCVALLFSFFLQNYALLFDRHPLENFAAPAFGNAFQQRVATNEAPSLPRQTACSQKRCGGSPLVIVPSLIGSQLFATLNDAQSEPHFWCSTNAHRYQLFL